jgi:hypothetical protein
MVSGPLMFLGPVFTFVIIIVALNVFGSISKARIKAKEKSVPGEFLEEFDRRLERLEDRIANIETIVLEKERYKKFSNL